MADVHWQNKSFTLCDTAGILFDFYGFKEEDIERLSQEQVDEALLKADLVLFVVSYKDGITIEDKEVIKKVRKTGKKTILVCNKADNFDEEKSCDNFRQLGANETIAISAVTGRRVADLLDVVVKEIENVSEKDLGLPKMAIIGRPNVGKSTIFNKLIGKDRSIVSSVAGTTRDSINEVLKIGSKEIEVIDTAGLRRRGRREVGVEKFSVFRTLDSISRADLVILLVDAKEGVTRGDARLAQLAIDKKKKIIIVVNKIDQLKTRLTTEVKDLSRYKFLTKIKTVAVSAKDGENLELLKLEIFKDI